MNKDQTELLHEYADQTYRKSDNTVSVEEKIFGKHSMTEPEARLIAQHLVRAAQCGILHDVLRFASELFEVNTDAPYGLVKILTRAPEDVDEITQ